MKNPSAVLYGHGGYGNRGCEALVRSTTALLRQVAPRVQVTLCSERHQGDLVAGMPGVGRVVPHEMPSRSLDRLRYAALRRLGAGQEALCRCQYGPPLRAIGRADVALSIGGDNYCYNPPRALYAIHGAAGGRTPLVLWATSIDPERITGDLLEDLRHYDRIFARETYTLEALRQAGLEAELCCDPAFTLKAEEIPLPEAFIPGETVGLNLSPLAARHAAQGFDLTRSAVALVRHILGSGVPSVALIPHVRWAHDDDVDALSPVLSAFAGDARVFLLSPDLRAPQVKYAISRLGCLIAARTHASIAAYSTGVPALVLGYSIKARGIAHDLLSDLPGTLLPVQDLSSPAALIQGYEALRAGLEAQRTLLKARLPEYTASIYEATKQVADLAGWSA